MNTIFKGKQKHGFIGIEKKISHIFAKVIIIGNILLGIIVSVLSYNSSVSAITRSIEETTKVAANLISTSLNEYKNVASEVGSMPFLANPETSSEEKKAIIEQRIATYQFIDGTILDGNGIDIFNGTDLSDKDYYKTSIKGEQYVATPTYSDIKKQVITTVSAPLWENGIPGSKPIGVIVFIPDGEFLNDIIRSIKIGNAGNAFMVDSEGYTIGDVDSSLVGIENLIEEGKKDASLRQLGKIVEKMAAGEAGHGTEFYDGHIEIVSYAPVPGTPGWNLGVCVIRSEFLGGFYLSLIVTIFIVILFTFTGIRIGRIYGKRIATPIIQCMDRIKLLEQGDLHSETPEIHSDDETEILINSLRITINSLQAVINDIITNLKELSEGNLNHTIDREYRGDFSVIVVSFRSIIENLNKVMKEIDGNAVHVATGSDELSNAAQGLAEGATDQASSIEELTATMTDINEKIQQNAASANKAADVVNQMNVDLQKSNEHMLQTTDAMGKIKSASQEIANIIMSINNIASQTNLLSLNAAIEAARAGDAGKGFAVVADQVRQLSEQSAVAAKNTSDLIENAIHAIDIGTEFTKVTAESLNNVVSKAELVHQTVNQIADASHLQAVSAEQITEGINQITNIVEMNSATAQECAASSEELSANSSVLKELIGRFKF